MKISMMTVMRLRFLLGLGLLSIALIIVAACTTADYGERNLEGRGDSTVELTCQPPVEDEQPQLSAALPLERFAGEYALTVVATSAFEDDTIAHGTLWLRPLDPRYRRAPNPDITFPLYGASDIDLSSLGPVSLPYSPASWSKERPGVLAVYDSAHRTLYLDMGAGEEDVFITDSGVFFDVFSIDSLGFNGRWMDGGLGDPLPAGYFCARRLPAVK